MQTFLPYPDFAASAKVLDRQRLGKQRVETYQLLNALHGGSKGWVNHPAARMWRRHTDALVEYGLAVCDEWRARGYVDNMRPRIQAFATGARPVMPPWLGDAVFHRSHRSNLLRKLPAHYRQHWPDLTDDIPYVWP